MPSIAQCLQHANQLLSTETDQPRLEAELLLAHALSTSRVKLLTWPEETVGAAQFKNFQDYLARRLSHEPMAYIMGSKEFWSLSFEVNAHTLIPRPETELLVEFALAFLPEKNQAYRLADLGTGSGAIALALAKERPHASIYAGDISQAALAIAKKNAQTFGLKNVYFFHGNWCTGLPEDGLDIIVCNPPYLAEEEWDDYAQGLAYEPRTALVSGKDGLSAIREVVKLAKPYLKMGAGLLLEHGFKQASCVREILTLNGYENVMTKKDLSGCERVTMGFKKREEQAK